MRNKTTHIHHERESIRYPGYDYSLPGAYFVTICTHERECLFGEIQDGKITLNEYGKIVLKWWKSLPDKYPHVSLDEFVIMPNHFHAVVWITVGAPLVGAPAYVDRFSWAGTRPAPTVSEMIGGFKSITTVEYIRSLRKHDPKSVVPKLWQRSYHDRIIRNEHELETVREYIRKNPSRWMEDEYH